MPIPASHALASPALLRVARARTRIRLRCRGEGQDRPSATSASSTPSGKTLAEQTQYTPTGAKSRPIRRPTASARAPAAPATGRPSPAPTALGQLADDGPDRSRRQAALDHRLLRLRPRALRDRRRGRAADRLLVPEGQPRRPRRLGGDQTEVEKRRRDPLVPDRGLQRPDAGRAGAERPGRRQAGEGSSRQGRLATPTTAPGAPPSGADVTGADGADRRAGQDRRHPADDGSLDMQATLRRARSRRTSRRSARTRPPSAPPGYAATIARHVRDGQDRRRQARGRDDPRRRRRRRDRRPTEGDGRRPDQVRRRRRQGQARRREREASGPQGLREGRASGTASDDVSRSAATLAATVLVVRRRGGRLRRRPGRGRRGRGEPHA